MKQTRDFHLGDVLSITTGCLLSPRHMEGVYDILGFMADETLWKHQLPRAAEECAPELRRQHPQLADIEVPEFTPESVEPWLSEQVARFGETLSVQPLPKREAQYDTPVADLIEMVDDPTKIIVVDP